MAGLSLLGLSRASGRRPSVSRARSDPHSPSLSPALPSAVPPALPPALFHPCRSPSPPLRSAARARRIVALVAPFFVPRPSAQAESPPSASTAQHSLSPSSPISPNALSPPLPSSAPARTPGAEAQGGCAGGRGCAAGAGAAAAVRCVLGARAALRARCGALGMCTVLWACVRCCEYVCGAVGMCAVLWVCVRCCEYVWCCRDVCEHYCSNPSCCYLFSLLPPRPSHSSLLSHLSSLIYHFSSLLSPLSSLFSPLLFQVASLSWRHQQLASALANSNAAAGAAGGSGASGGGSGAAAAAAAAGDGAAKEAEKEMNPANPMHLHAAPPASPPPPPKTVRKRRKAKPTDLINQRRWQQFYRNIVLIVNYKRPQQMPVTLDLLHSLYGSLFQRILAVSEFGDADLGVLESPVKETGHGHDLPPGSLHYSVLPKLLTWHPMAEGFLWMDDDTVLNYWTMSRDNKSRIWFLGPMHQSWRIASLDPSGSVAGGWGGQGKEAGAVRYMEDASERVEESGEALQLLKEAVSQALSHLPQQHLQQYQQSISPKTNIFLRAASDVFYIPQRHAPAMRSLVPIFADHRIVADALGAFVNGALAVIGLGLVGVALWMLLDATYGECLLPYQLPVIVVGAALLLAALVGFCGLACDSNSLSCLYLVVALIAVLASTAFTSEHRSH
ncbi:unnamed protein product [Closterium sp. NIES-53]